MEQQDVSVVNARRLEEDEELGLTLDNSKFTSQLVRRGTVRGVDGAFVLANLMTKEGTLTRKLCSTLRVCHREGPHVWRPQQAVSPQGACFLQKVGRRP